MNWYMKPFVSIYLVQTEDSDHYKKELKIKLKNWVQQMQERNQEYLIVYLNLGQKSKVQEFSNKLHRTVFDKIKSDFNSKKVVQLRIDELSTLSMLNSLKENKYEILWDEFLNKLKECISNSFEQVIEKIFKKIFFIFFKYVNNYEEEIRKMDSKRREQGWNYCHFFLIKVTYYNNKIFF